MTVSKYKHIQKNARFSTILHDVHISTVSCSKMSCAFLCDADERCGAFSFKKTATGCLCNLVCMDGDLTLTDEQGWTVYKAVELV